MDWHLIISLATLVLVIFTIVWGTGLWARREKVEIKTTGLNYKTLEDRITLKLFSTEIKRSGEKEVRCLNQIWLKPDKHSYNELRQCFSLPENGELMLAEGRLELRKGYPKLVERWNDYEYSALVDMKQDEQRNKVNRILSEMSKRTFEIGLVWDDSRKTTWKTISPGELGKWVRL
jgi:hypothetical protein